MKSVLVILVHPNLHQSTINQALVRGASEVDGVVIHDLYECYPDGVIDIEAEQKRIEQFDTLVFQHPFYWYSCPSLLKEWFDLVLQYNYAYGPKGEALANKNWLSVISTGGGKDAYCAEGHNRFSIRELLTPFDQTAHLCHMTFLPPFISYGSRGLGKTPAELTQKVAQYQQVLSELVADKHDYDADLATMNQRWSK